MKRVQKKLREGIGWKEGYRGNEEAAAGEEWTNFSPKQEVENVEKQVC